MLVELVSIVKVFDCLIKAAKDVAKILHNIELAQTDREAEVFSLVAFQDQPEITMFSMYKLDNSLLYGVRMLRMSK
jgi:hypothetical protein